MARREIRSHLRSSVILEPTKKTSPVSSTPNPDSTLALDLEDVLFNSNQAS